MQGIFRTPIKKALVVEKVKEPPKKKVAAKPVLKRYKYVGRSTHKKRWKENMLKSKNCNFKDFKGMQTILFN